MAQTDHLHIFPDRINNVVAILAHTSNLANKGFERYLDRYLDRDPGVDSVSVNMMAATVEAIIGAAFLDGDNQLDSLHSLMAILGLTWPL